MFHPLVAERRRLDPEPRQPASFRVVPAVGVGEDAQPPERVGRLPARPGVGRVAERDPVRRGVEGVLEGRAGAGQVEVHQPGGAAVPDHHVLRGHVQVADQPGRILADRAGRKRVGVRHETGRRRVQPAQQAGHRNQQLLGLHPDLRDGPGALPGQERQHIPALRVPAQEPRGTAEPGVLQPVQVRPDGQGLRLVRPADGPADPHHTLGDIARRQKFDVGRLACGGEVDAGLNRCAVPGAHRLSVRRP